MDEIVIKIVTNGFIVRRESELEDGHFIESVYAINSASEFYEAFADLLYGEFSEYLQSKHSGGLEIKVHRSGYS